jgi:hypothetical protein
VLSSIVTYSDHRAVQSILAEDRNVSKYRPKTLWRLTAATMHSGRIKPGTNYLVSNAKVSIGDVEPMLLDVVQTLSRVNARGRFVSAQFH